MKGKGIDAALCVKFTSKSTGNLSSKPFAKNVVAEMKIDMVQMLFWHAIVLCDIKPNLNNIFMKLISLGDISDEETAVLFT